MSIKDILSAKNDEAREYFWAIAIEPGWVQAGVWRVHEDATQIMSFSSPMAWGEPSELVSAVDSVLSSSLQNFPEDEKEPTNAVFGVVASWVSEGEISEKHIDKIKEICTKLSLTPVGFVVLPEAISHFIKSEEGSPLNACILGLSKEELEITVFKLGKMMGTSQVARSLSIVDDVVEGLTRFSDANALPSRIILYDGKEGELEEVKQTLLKANWDDVSKVKFLHTPKIETFNPKKKINAVSLAGASELADVTSVLELKEEKDQVEGEGSQNIVASDEINPQDLGFAVGQDIAEAPPQEKEATVAEDEQVPQSTASMASDEEIVRSGKERGVFNFLKEKIEGRFKVTGRKKLASVGAKSFTFGIAFLVLVIVGFFAFWWFYPKAVVTIYLSTKKLEERVDISVDPGLEIANFSDKNLPGEVLATTVNGDKTKSTTGTKTVGENAKGEVTLYRVGSEISLPSDTVIIGPNNLEFTLDSSVTVASGSASTPGTTKTAVTAQDIGAQYNLTSGTNFSIQNYSTSDIEAKNESSFSGGTSRDISAVSKEDQENLEQDLFNELQEKTSDEFLKNLEEDNLFIEETLTATSSAKSFSSKIGDEASTLKLSLTISAQGIAVKKDDLFELSKKQLEDKIPDGFVLRSEQVDLEFDYIGQEKGVYDLRLTVSANLLPAVDPDVVKNNLVGRYPKVVESYLKSEIPGFSRAEISFKKPRFPGRLGTLPRVAGHIEVEIAAER